MRFSEKDVVAKILFFVPLVLSPPNFSAAGTLLLSLFSGSGAQATSANNPEFITNWLGMAIAI